MTHKNIDHTRNLDSKAPIMPPTESPPTTTSNERPVLCLSGGGFRATLFHLGVLRRLNEFGLLSKLAAVTSVSGGSILNGMLATRWTRLVLGENGVFTNLEKEIEEPVESFCKRDLRTGLLLLLRINPLNWAKLLRDYFSVSANYLAKAYEPFIPGTLAEVPLPNEHTPRFVFCATNVLTGACWHFHAGPGGRMGDFYAGYCDAGNVKVSEAAAASSAFTPGFSALRLLLPKHCVVDRVDPWGELRQPTPQQGKHSQATTVVLTDGGVYDNMGVEPVWRNGKVLLVSEAGRPFAAVPSNRQLFTTRLLRAMDISIEQVGAVRRRWLVEDFISKKRQGAIWTIHTPIEDFPTPEKQGYGSTVRSLISNIRTDLNAFSAAEIACLKNHGYSLTDAAIRSRVTNLKANYQAGFQWPDDKWLDEPRINQALATSHDRHILRDVGRLIVRLGRP